MGKIIVIGSQKGGVGKTTTTLNLAYSLREMGKKVLTVDFDSQANLTTCYGIEDTGALEYTIGHLMMAQIEEELPENFEDYIQSREGVDYIPSSIYLSVVDAKLRTEMGAERMLAEVLELLRSRYDYILIDTCPALGMLTINALAAADEVIITVNPQLLAMMGLQDFLRTVGKIKKRINPRLEIAGILLTMCESRTTLCKVLTEEVTGSFQGKIKVFQTRIPATVKVIIWWIEMRILLLVSTKNVIMLYRMCHRMQIVEILKCLRILSEVRNLQVIFARLLLWSKYTWMVGW